VRQVDPSITPLTEVIVLRLLQKRREDRYQTPHELLQKLDEALRALEQDRAPVPAPPPAVAPRPAPIPMARRRPR
jgi:hypothetical protein